ncbi:MAG: phosphatase PAP2 family protein [Candidatus Omnitrophota bacterium]
MIFFAKYFFIIIFPLCICYIFFKKNKRIVYLSFISAISILFINKFIEFFWLRPRPFIMDSVNLLVKHKLDGSFPSDHASVSMAIAVMLFFVNKKIGTILIISSLFIGISRIFCGLHYPLDIFVGLFLGWLVSLIIYKISKKFIYEK